MAQIQERPGKVTFKTAFLDFFKGYVDFKGRSTRAGYWWMQLIVGIISIFLIVWAVAPLISFVLTAISSSNASSVVDELSEREFLQSLWGSMGPLIVLVIFSLAIFVPNLALQVRRVRDVGIRGRAQVLLIIINILFGSFTTVNIATTVQNGYQTGASYSPIQMIFTLGLFIVTLLPTGTFTTEKTSGVANFFFKQKSSFIDPPEDVEEIKNSEDFS
ncbi:DUF805 domain-containing protein [Enterococcus timonensis]|uniref:DUF805 domain-containing protein n=1 Tax=Enterococcus timonensis TaxID=1852364 RepID=UPI0008D9B901|nr:DUF805 domain-containing protein [Enterococcus timonensis]